MKNNRGFQFFTSVKWTGFLLVFYVGLLVWVPAGAEELKKEEQLQLAQTILREASAEIQNLSDANFPSYGPAWISNKKVQLLEKVATVQGKVPDQEGLRETADRAVEIAQTNISNIYPLTVIGNRQVNAGFFEDGVRTAEVALDAVRFHKQQRNMDAWLPFISGTFLRGGKIGKALEALHMIVDERDRVVVLRDIGLQEAKNGHDVKAKELLAQSQRLLAKLDDPQYKAWDAVYGAIHLFELNKKAEATVELAQAKTMVQAVTDYDSRARLKRKLVDIIHKWGPQEQFEESVNEAEHAIEMIPEVSSRVAQYADFVELLNQCGLKSRAAVLLMKAREDVLLDEDPSGKMTSFLSLADKEWKSGHLKVATELVKLAVDALAEIEDPGRIGSSLLWFFFNTHTIELVIPQDLKRIQQKVDSFSRNDNERRHLDLVTLAMLQAQHGHFQHSLETIGQIQGAPSSKGFSTQFFGKEFVAMKGIEQALVWAEGLPSQVEGIYAHIGIAEGILEKLDAQANKEDNEG